MNIKNAKLFSLIISLLLIFNSKAISSIITYKEILDNPTDLELNLNYAKQQEKSGNVKSTIATLERLSKLYPKNSDIKLYLMDKYNHDTSNSDAAKEVFQYGKFTTVDSSGLTGLGTFVFEGAHDASASPAGEAAYVQSIERLEGSTVVIGKALE